MRRRSVVAALLAGTLVTACSTESGVTSLSADRELVADVELEVDPETRLFTLDNGLVVYVRNNNRPGGSAEMRLAVNAGSAMEEADQAGVAHFLEHMLFNGTEQFPGNDLIDVLRGFGMEFGADVNAYTSYDETVYELHVPAEADNLETGVEVLAEWLSAATIDADEVVAERGVVLDEWRVRDQTLDGRQFQALADLFLAGSPYDDRQPIGSDSAIESMTEEPLRRFYDTWYRPDNAAVIVVGDIDVDAVEAMVRDQFEGLEPRGVTPVRPDLSMPAFTTSEVLLLGDPDATEMSAELTWPSAADEGDGLQSVREELVLQLGFDIVATRLADDVTRGEAPFRIASRSDNSFVRTLDAPSVYVIGDAEETEASVRALVEEFERVRRFGVDDNELRRALSPIEAAVQAAYDARDTTQDVDLADSFVGHFLYGDMIADPEETFEVLTGMLEGITAEDVGAAFTSRLEGTVPYLYVGVPEADLGSSSMPSEDALRDLVDGMTAMEVEPREGAAAVGDGLMQAPDAVEEVSTTELADEPWMFLSPTQYDFGNGIRVVINPTDISDNDVQVAVFSPGGSSLLTPEQASIAHYGPWVQSLSGLGELDAVQVSTVLEGSTIDLTPYIDATEEGIYGGFASDDLELAMQLMHLWFTEPRFDQAALDTVKDGDRALIADPSADADLAAYVALTEARYGSDLRFAAMPTMEQLDAVTTADVEDMFRDRFSGGDWVFVFSGDLDPVQARDLARSYLGTLPGGGEAETFIDHSPDMPAGIVERAVEAGTGQQASLTMLMEAPSTDTERDGILADLLTNVLDTRLTDTIREALGASYSPSAYVNVYPDLGKLEVYLQVSGDPDGMDELVAAVRAELADIATDGPSATEFDGAMAAMDEEYQLFGNGQVAWEIVHMVDDPEYVDVYLSRYDELLTVTSDELAAFAERALPLDQFIQVTQLPR